MRLIIGLGNPGKEYVATRHNFGFRAVDAFVQSHEAVFSTQAKFKADTTQFHERGESIVVAKPQTFMNLSGEAVVALVNFYKLEPKDVWVVCDDLDLPLGKIRVRHGGETGGHHGLDSINASLGTKEYGRIRLGVRGEELRKEHLENNIDGTQFVMESFADKEQPLVQRTIEQVVMLLDDGLTAGELKAHTYEVDGFDDHSGDHAA